MNQEEKRAHLESLQVPTISLNGSDPSQLAKNLEDAYLAINEACRALNECAPHGRDYPRLSPTAAGAFTVAYKQHMARGRQLCDVMDELCHLAHNIREAHEARNSNKG